MAKYQLPEYYLVKSINANLKKLLEECKEDIESTGEDRIEELADLLEVMMALGKVEFSLEDIINVCQTKRQKRGAFDEMIYLEDVKKI